MEIYRGEIERTKVIKEVVELTKVIKEEVN